MGGLLGPPLLRLMRGLDLLIQSCVVRSNGELYRCPVLTHRSGERGQVVNVLNSHGPLHHFYRAPFSDNGFCDMKKLSFQLHLRMGL